LTHPATAFLLGLTLWLSVVLSELLNIYKSQTYDTINGLIASYITFRVSISLPFMYYDAMNKSNVRIFNSFAHMKYKRRKYRDTEQ
jgi:hypothetical protein